MFLICSLCKSLINSVIGEEIKNDPYGYLAKATTAGEYAESMWQSEYDRTQQYLIQKKSKTTWIVLCQKFDRPCLVSMYLCSKIQPQLNDAREQLLNIERSIDRILATLLSKQNGILLKRK